MKTKLSNLYKRINYKDLLTLLAETYNAIPKKSGVSFSQPFIILKNIRPANFPKSNGLNNCFIKYNIMKL